MKVLPRFLGWNALEKSATSKQVHSLLVRKQTMGADKKR